MGWKDWSYWLKGGIIANIIAAVIWGVFAIAINSGVDLGLPGWISLPVLIISYPFMMVPMLLYFVFLYGVFSSFCKFEATMWFAKATCPTHINIIAGILVVVLSIAIYFAAGAFIGFMVGRIRGKN